MHTCTHIQSLDFILRESGSPSCLHPGFRPVCRAALLPSICELAVTGCLGVLVFVCVYMKAPTPLTPPHYQQSPPPPLPRRVHSSPWKLLFRPTGILGSFRDIRAALTVNNFPHGETKAGGDFSGNGGTIGAPPLPLPTSSRKPPTLLPSLPLLIIPFLLLPLLGACRKPAGRRSERTRFCFRRTGRVNLFLLNSEFSGHSWCFRESVMYQRLMGPMGAQSQSVSGTVGGVVPHVPREML